MTTTFLVPKNNAASTLSSGIDNVVTAIPITDVTQFPATFPFHVTIENEIIRVNGIIASTFDPVVRGQEGTAAAAHSIALDVELLITAKAVSDLNTAVNALEVAKQTEIDMGSIPTRNKVFTVTDADVGVGSRLLAVQAGDVPTGKVSADENEMDRLAFACNPAAGTFSLYVTALDGAVVGNYKVNYRLG